MIPARRLDLGQAGRQLRFGLGLAGMFLSTVVITLALVAVIASIVPRWNGTVVASGSMEPALRRGDTVIYVDQELDEAAVGNVVVFDNADGVSIVHRIVGIEADGALTTRGDANQSNDSGAVTADRYDGSGIVVVPWIGLPRLWWMEGKHLLVLATAAIVFVAARSSRLTTEPANDPWHGSSPVTPASHVFEAAPVARIPKVASA